VRGTLPLGNRGVALVSTLEPFVSFNTTGWGQRGLRPGARLCRRLPAGGQGIAIEAGYMGQYVARYRQPDRMNHVISLSLSLRR
jgi:hypothetical protein